MDFPTLIPKPSSNQKVNLKEEGTYGVHNTMTNGFSCVRSQMCVPHPLEASERNYESNAENLRYAYLRSTQGLHAVLRLHFEKKAAQQVRRLPFLASSNIMNEALEGTDETISFENILNDHSEPEVLAPPHMIMEKHLHLF